MVLIQGELRHTKVLYLVLVRQEVVKLVLVVVANRSDVKELDIILKGNPEATIVQVLKVHLLLGALSPLI